MSIHIAVQGCCHGELNSIYADLTNYPSSERPDLLLICGDFQALRSEADFDSIAMPNKYKQLGDFHEYYNGTRVAPVLTIFIGGNHESSGFLHELRDGGWVAPNIYYMGYSGVVWYKGLRIGGLSGIYKPHDFYRTHDESLPLKGADVRSVYHSRFEDWLKMMLLSGDLSVMMSHDWPEGVYRYGDLKGLLRRKKHFKSDVEKGELGSTPNMKLLQQLQAMYWFSAHMHVRFEATIKYDTGTSKRKMSLNLGEKENLKKSKSNKTELILNNDEIELHLDNDRTSNNQEEISLDIDDETSKTPNESAKVGGYSQTNFLALDKCLPNRQHIEFLHIPITNSNHSSTEDSHLHLDRTFVQINRWLEKFRNREVYKKLTVQEIDHDFIAQFCREIATVPVEANELIIDSNFHSRQV